MATRLTSVTPEKKQIVLEWLARGYTIARAAAKAKMHRQSLWQARKRDPEFDKQCVEAYNAGTDAIEDTLVDDGKKGDTTARIFLLKARNPEKFRDKFQADINVGPTTDEECINLMAQKSEVELRGMLAKIKSRRTGGSGA